MHVLLRTEHLGTDAMHNLKQHQTASTDTTSARSLQNPARAQHLLHHPLLSLTQRAGVLVWCVCARVRVCVCLCVIQVLWRAPALANARPRERNAARADVLTCDDSSGMVAADVVWVGVFRSTRCLHLRVSQAFVQADGLRAHAGEAEKG
jgi:hypothetical protein